MKNWLTNRLYDMSRWPLNLVRDGGQRFLRLQATCQHLVQLVSHPHMWSRDKWLFLGHKFACECFDLLGGPDLVQIVYRAMTHTTPLTETEKMMVRSVLGEQTPLRLDEIRVASGGLLDYIFERNGGLAYSTWYTVNFPREGKHNRHNYPLLIHEITHALQYHQVGSRYLGEAIYVLVKTQRQCYDYGGMDGLHVACEAERPLASFNREQQAQIAQDYFARCERGGEIESYRPFITQLQQGDL